MIVPVNRVCAIRNFLSICRFNSFKLRLYMLKFRLDTFKQPLIVGGLKFYTVLKLCLGAFNLFCNLSELGRTS